MSPSEQHRAVYALVLRAQGLSVRLNDRRADDQGELGEELRSCANAFEVLALDARRLAGKLEEELSNAAE